MPEYTVVAVYRDGQRFADTYETDSPRDAESLALHAAEENGAELIVAGVLEGRHQMVDTYTDGLGDL